MVLYVETIDNFFDIKPKVLKVSRKRQGRFYHLEMAHVVISDNNLLPLCCCETQPPSRTGGVGTPALGPQTRNAYIEHKGEVWYIYISQRGNSPFVYRDGTGWPASLPYIRKIRVSVAIGIRSGIRLHKRVPMVKIWRSSKNDQNRTMGKLLKL